MHATFKEEDNHYGVACGIRFALHCMPFSVVLRREGLFYLRL
jgi:hypothetical protein